MTVASIILAAGRGTRMRSKLPKVLHPLAGKPLVWHALNAVENLTTLTPVLVVGYRAEAIREVLEDRARYALQVEQLGTGHAVAAAQLLLEGEAEIILVTFADMPLLRRETLAKLLELHSHGNSPVTMTSIIGEEARGFGRVVRDPSGKVSTIVEQAVATPEQLAIREYNVSAYCFDAQWLWEALTKIPLSPKGEYYLTDVVGLAVDAGYSVDSLILSDPQEAIGLNNRVHLAAAEKVMRERINTGWMLNGVTFTDPDTTYIEADVQIGPDTTLVDTRVGNEVRLIASVLEGAQVADRVTMGPFCHLRKGAILDEGVHLGNFAEVKDSYLGAGTRMGHFSYIGNAKIGANVNIGAGTITCNYDGKQKHPTEIGDDVFLGSDTMLVAPVKIGDRSITGAGAVVTRDVPQDTLVVGVPAKEKRKLEKSD